MTIEPMKGLSEPIQRKGLFNTRSHIQHNKRRMYTGGKVREKKKE